MLAESSIQLVPDGTLILHFVVIGLMVFVVNKTLLGPINRILSERDRHILGQTEEAQGIIATSEQKVKAYTSAMRDARTEGYRLLENERARALHEREQSLLAFKEELAHRTASEIDKTRQQEANVRLELETQATALSRVITSEILGRD